jgi:hypothetical protein
LLRESSFQSAPADSRGKQRDDKTPEFGKERNADEASVVVKGVAPRPPTGKENAFKYFPPASSVSKQNEKCKPCQSPAPQARVENRALSQRELLERNWVDLRDPPSIRYLPASASPFKGLDSPFRRLSQIT